MNRYLPSLLLVLLTACGGGGTPPPDLPEKPPETLVLQLSVVTCIGDGGPGESCQGLPKLAGATLIVDAITGAQTNANGWVDTKQKRGEHSVRLEAPSYLASSFTIDLTRNAHKDVRLKPERAPEVRGRLKIQGRKLLYPDGTPFDWKGLTAFRLLEQVAHGHEADAVTFLRWGRGLGYNLVRVFAQLDGGMFTLTPEDGRAALPRFLQLAAREDVYVEIVPLVSTKGEGGGYPRQDRPTMRTQVQGVGAACAAVPNCVLELANENSHPAQVPDLVDVPFLRELRALVPADVPVSLGSTHGGEDESTIFKDGDYMTVHLDRGRDKWNMERRVRELEGLSASTDNYVVSDEPIKFTSQMPDCAIAFAFGAHGRGMSIGTTYHFDQGLQAQPATGSAETCAKDLLDGTTTVPMGLHYTNAGFGDSPVKGADFGNCIVRAYSFVGGPEERTVLSGITCDPKVVWQNGYRPTVLLGERPGVQVWRVEK